MSAASLGTLPSSTSQRDKYGRLVEDLVVMGITKHLGISPGSLNARKQLIDVPLLEKTRAGLSDAFYNLIHAVHEEWRKRTRQSRPGADPRAFQMLEADLWCVVTSLDGLITRLPVLTPSFASVRLGGDSTQASGSTGGDQRDAAGTLICLKVKLCKLERLLEYEHHHQEQVQLEPAQQEEAHAPLGHCIIAALGTEAAAEGMAEQSEGVCHCECGSAAPPGRMPVVGLASVHQHSW